MALGDAQAWQEKSAVDQGDPTFRCERVSVVCKAVWRHEEPFVHALMRHDTAQFTDWLDANGLAPRLALNNRRASTGIRVVLKQPDIDTSVRPQSGGIGPNSLDPVEVATHIFEKLPFDSVDDFPRPCCWALREAGARTRSATRLLPTGCTLRH